MSAPNDMHKAFVVEYAANGGNATAAAKEAGYSERSAAELGRKLLTKPHVRDAVNQELRALQHKGGAVALHALLTMTADEGTGAAARFSAAKALLEFAGLGRASDQGSINSEGATGSGEVIDYRAFLGEIAALRRSAS